MTPYSIFLLLVVFFIINKLLIFGLKKTNVYQQIYELSPESHSNKKNTPTFGGVGFVICLLVGVISFQLLDLKIMWCMSMCIAFSTIGFMDDMLSFKKKLNKGFSARQKFLLQCVVSGIGLGLYSVFLEPITAIEYFVYGFILVGTSNATNLTDGLDGLLTGISIIAMTGFLLLFLELNNSSFQSFTTIIILALLGFLMVNKYPAQIFLGDTGSLGIGALFGSLAVVIKNPWVLLCLGGVFVIETLSVIIQVVYYKRTKKRVFLMSPLHHHFELCGLSEQKTVLLFWAISTSFLGIFIVSYLN